MSSYDEAREAARKAVDRFDCDHRPDLNEVANAAIDAFLGKLSADSEMVERVAAALAMLPIRDSANFGGELDQLRLREAARAAIAAMLAQEVKR